MNKYYQVSASIDGKKETLYGSFQKADCKDELRCERENWKEDGYKSFKIEAVDTADTPSPEVYQDEIVSKEELFLQQAPSFNFEYDVDQLLEIALEKGFVSKIVGMEDQYLINKDY